MNPSLEDAYRSPEAAEEYAERHEKTAVRRMASRREFRIIAKLLGEGHRGERLLDAACGAGRISAFLRAKGRAPVSLDASLQMLRQGMGKGNLAPGRALNASIFRLPFKDKSLDSCVCSRFLHHLPGKDLRLAVLRELRRAVKGPIVLSLWTGFNLQSLRRSVKGLFGRRPSARYTSTLSGFRGEAALCGLSVRKIRFLFPLISETVYFLLWPEESG